MGFVGVPSTFKPREEVTKNSEEIPKMTKKMHQIKQELKTGYEVLVTKCKFIQKFHSEFYETLLEFKQGSRYLCTLLEPCLK